MQRDRLSPNGPEISRIAYGTWRFNQDSQGESPERVLSKLNACLEVGITTLDTAEIYGDYEVEGQLGAAFKLETGLRDKFEIVTKCGIYIHCAKYPKTRVAHYNAERENILRAAENSLKLLGTDRIDVLLVHRPDWLTAAEETAAALNKLIHDGKVLHVGVSNYNIHQFETLNSMTDSPLVTNQVEFSLFNMNPIFDGTFDLCQRLRIRPMVWSALAGGRLFGGNEESSDRLRAAAAELADRYDGATLEQLAIAWVLTHPSRPQVILGTNRIDRIREQAKATKLKLDREDWYHLCEVARGKKIP